MKASKGKRKEDKKASRGKQPTLETEVRRKEDNKSDAHTCGAFNFPGELTQPTYRKILELIEAAFTATRGCIEIPQKSAHSTGEQKISLIQQKKIRFLFKRRHFLFS